MLEHYIKNFNAERFLQKYRAEKGCRTMSDALALARKEIPKESYFQTKVKQGLKARYPEAYVRKISQGMYSEGGIPDILFIYRGHYFGFEIKRPLVGIESKLQQDAIRQIERAGGTAAFVRWPEEAYQIIDGAVKEGRI